jgi:hypothetical protein
MNFPAPLAIAIRTLADWLDDRLTIAAIGLATGYFGFGDAQWGAISNWIMSTATVILVLVPDPRRLERQNAAARSEEIPEIELVGRSEAEMVDLSYPMGLPVRGSANTGRPDTRVRQSMRPRSRSESENPPTRNAVPGFGDKY